MSCFFLSSNECARGDVFKTHCTIFMFIYINLTEAKPLAGNFYAIEQMWNMFLASIQYACIQCDIMTPSLCMSIINGEKQCRLLCVCLASLMEGFLLIHCKLSVGIQMTLQQLRQ